MKTYSNSRDRQKALFTDNEWPVFVIGIEVPGPSTPQGELILVQNKVGIRLK